MLAALLCNLDATLVSAPAGSGGRLRSKRDSRGAPNPIVLAPVVLIGPRGRLHAQIHVVDPIRLDAVTLFAARGRLRGEVVEDLALLMALIDED